MRKTLIKFLSRDDIKKALYLNDLKYCYDLLEKFVDLNKLTSNAMAEFTKLLLDINVDPLQYLDKIYTFQFIQLPITDINIPTKIKSIGNRSFSGCKKIKSVTIPDSVVKIDDGAFQNCYSLENIIIPDSVTEIGWGAFLYCTSLKSITIPDSVMSIGYRAFAGCTNLAFVSIPKRFKNELELSFEDQVDKINFTFR